MRIPIIEMAPAASSIWGIGFDITETKRFLDLYKHYGVRLAEKILQTSELAQVKPMSLSAQSLQIAFAKKEALIKALGLNVFYRQLVIRENDIEFDDQAADVAKNAKIIAASLRLTLLEEIITCRVQLFSKQNV